MSVLIAGVDLGVRGRSTGFALVEHRGRASSLLEVYTVTPGEAASLIASLEPLVVVIDSPLSMPKQGPWRSVDLLARRLGLRVLPPGWRGMARLVETALQLLETVWRGPRSIVLETHPSSVARIAGCGVEELAERLSCRLLAEWRNSHERDAVIAALVGVAFLRGYWGRIEARDGSIWLVDPIICRYPPTTGSRNSLPDEPRSVT